MKRGEDPYRATPPPWQGWPSAETSRRRWRIGLLVPLVGAAGCGLLFLLNVRRTLETRLSVPMSSPVACSQEPAPGAGGRGDDVIEAVVTRPAG